MGFFKRSFCDLASGGGIGKEGWGRVGEGLGGGVGEGLGWTWLSTLQKPRLKTPVRMFF